MNKNILKTIEYAQKNRKSFEKFLEIHKNIGKILENEQLMKLLQDKRLPEMAKFASSLPKVDDLINTSRYFDRYRVLDND